MNVNNIALVRATDIIPFDGLVKPISEVPYLKENTGTEFAFSMNDLLKRTGKLPPSPMKLTDEYVANTHAVSMQYLPYMSDYNSMSLWAINGLVPDDSENGFGNNTFSNKKCVVIDGLAEQLKLSNVVSLMPTDTAIRGTAKLSSSAIILIEQNMYDSLTENQKKQLSKFCVKTFSGDLRHAVEQTLLETGRYIPERPTLSRSDGGYRKSDTSDELINTINNVAKQNNILQMYHWDVIWNSYNKITGELAKELDNFNLIHAYFQKSFFKYLSKKININDDLAYHLNNSPDNKYYIDQLCDKIEEYGLDNYKKLVTEYNQKLENLRKNGKLLTPQQIVDTIRNHKQKKDEETQNNKGFEIDD